MPPVDVADAATPAQLLVQVRQVRAIADSAEAQLMLLAIEWAHAHPVLAGDEAWKVRVGAQWQPGEVDASVVDGTEEELEWCGIPPVRWDAPAAFAAACSMSTSAGKAYLRDALVLRHRLPLMWSRVAAGEVPVWRARRVAQAVLGAPADVVVAIDEAVVDIVESVGPITLDRLLDEAMLRLHAEEREIAQLEALDARYVHVDEDTINATGIADLSARGDWKDLHDLDQTLAAVAAALKTSGCSESLDVRRSMALGVLADPARAHALLNTALPNTDPDTDAADSLATDTTDVLPAPTKRIVLFLHLTQDAIAGRDSVGRNETTGRPELVQSIREWCSRTDTHLTVTPVIDLAEQVQVDSYEIPERLKTRIRLTHTKCVFPWCTRPARACDCDHIQSHATGGPTSTHNLAPLCRHHHRLKTKAGWTYRPLDPVADPGTFDWTDPHDLHYQRGPTGTTSPTSIVDPADPDDHAP